ncbi:hypothetical protein [Clostridium sp. DL-VIII]|uniref:hypothetical protein n=1 Tax=Clostridium sp. DL-VIII TaxID=641107 RepID=UPI0016421BED|nr:hypothetical protein [Clostridium sp. DL-VIII]
MFELLTKTELITEVSYDLRTPFTDHITYCKIKIEGSLFDPHPICLTWCGSFL